MLSIDRLCDDYEIHRRRNADLIDRDFVNLAVTVCPEQPGLYRQLLTFVGDGLIAAGQSLKGHVDGSTAWSRTTRLT